MVEIYVENIKYDYEKLFSFLPIDFYCHLFFSFPVKYKNRVDSNSLLGANQKVIDEELKKKEEEYQNSAEIALICELYETMKVRSK